MGAAPSIGEMVRDQEERKYKKLEKLPPAVADVKMRRLENQELAVKFNREGGYHKFQEHFGEYTNNPLDWALGIGKKPPPAPPEEDDSPESFFMRMKLAKKMDWEDPEKKQMRRTETAEDQSQHIIRVSCAESVGYEIVEVEKHPYAVKAHRMRVEELELSDLMNVHIVFKEKLESWMFYAKGVRDWPTQEAHVDPASFNSIILQFKAAKEEFKEGHSIEEKIIDRYEFLRLLHALDVTSLTDKRIDLGWDPNGDDPITAEEEPMLPLFEAKQVLHYYKELGGSDAKQQRKVDAKKIGRISIKDAFRIVIGTLIGEASEYKPLVAVASTHRCNNATAVEIMQRKRRRAAERLEAKAVGKLGRMRGPKQDMRQVVQKVAYWLFKSYKPVLDDIVYFEFATTAKGRQVMRRNSAWEFAAQMDSFDLIRPMQRFLEITTLNNDTKGWTEVSSNPEVRAAQKGADAGFESEEEQHYILAKWLRHKVLRAVRVHELRAQAKPASALDIAMNKKKGRDAIKDAKAKQAAASSETYTRKVESIVYPALVERQRREREEGISDLDRAQAARGKAWKLLDALEGMED